jgi:hypothetical protein
MLDSFRKVYGESEFTCRFECPRRSDGFSSLEKRDEHEKTHTKPFRCADPSCEFFDRGFASKTGLQKHNRKYHPSPENAELPKFGAKKPVEPPYVPPPAPPPREPTPPSPEKAPERPRVPVKKKRERTGKRGLRVHNCPNCSKVGSISTGR